MKLYRAISQDEKNNYSQLLEFNTGRNTLEGKQFFKSPTAIINFVGRAVAQGYDPPYLYLLIIDIDEACLDRCNPDHMNLDGFEAVSIAEDDLVIFNNCTKFVVEEVL